MNTINKNFIKNITTKNIVTNNNLAADKQPQLSPSILHVRPEDEELDARVTAAASGCPEVDIKDLIGER